MDRRSLKTPVTPHQTLSPMDQRSGRKDGSHHQGGHRQIFQLPVDQRAAPPFPRLVGRLQLCQAIEGPARQETLCCQPKNLGIQTGYLPYVDKTTTTETTPPNFQWTPSNYIPPPSTPPS